MKNLDMKERYRKDGNLREYVGKFCKKHNLTVDEALNHALVKEVAEYYLEQENGRIPTEKSTYAVMGECK